MLMIKFKSRNIDNEETEYSFVTVADLKEQYCSPEYGLPFSDDPVHDVQIHSVPIYVGTFYDLLVLLGIIDSAIKRNETKQCGFCR